MEEMKKMIDIQILDLKEEKTEVVIKEDLSDKITMAIETVEGNLIIEIEEIIEIMIIGGDTITEVVDSRIAGDIIIITIIETKVIIISIIIIEEDMIEVIIIGTKEVDIITEEDIERV